MTYSIGDPNHIGIHNELATVVGDLADQMSVDVDLPPQRNLGDLGHTDDHNLLQAALDKIAAGVVPGLNPAPVISKPSTVSGPEVQEWLVRDKQGARKVVYFLPGNTGEARSLALTDEGAAALEARRDVLDAIATTDVPEDYEGDPVTLLPKKLRAELRGFVAVRAAAASAAVYSVTLGAGVLPGVMVGAGGAGGSFYMAGLAGDGSWSSNRAPGGGGGAGGVIGQGAHVPVILPVQGTATYTINVASTFPRSVRNYYADGQPTPTTIAIQGQTPFAAALVGGHGGAMGGQDINEPGTGASGGGAHTWGAPADAWGKGAEGVTGQGHRGGSAGSNKSTPGGGGGYGGAGGDGNGAPGAGFDLATALNLDPNDGITGQFLSLVSVDGWIAGGGAGQGGTATAGGGAHQGNARDYTGGGGGGCGASNDLGGTGGAGAVFIITDPT